MARFSVENMSDKAVELAIEPWADLEIIEPKGVVKFEYDEPAHVDFAVTKDGEAFLRSIPGRWLSKPVDNTTLRDRVRSIAASDGA